MLRSSTSLIRRSRAGFCLCRQLQTSGKARMASAKLVPAKALDGLGKNLWVEFTALAAETKAVNLGQGFPDYSPPQFVVDALVEAAKTPLLNQYTRSQGHPRLVKALAKMYSIIHGREINPMTEVIITLGAYSCLGHIIRAFLEPGDEVILIEPFFDCYAPMSKISGAKIVYVPLRPQGKYPGSARDWALDPQELEAAFSHKTKMIIVNTPHNPFGKVFTKSELEVIADLCKRYDVMCVSDEVYEWMVFSGNKHVRMASLPGMWERTVTIGCAGKTFNATGWKTGWTVGPEYLIKPMQTVHTNTAYTMITPIQEAIAVGIELETSRMGQPGSYFMEVPAMLEKKRDETIAVLREAGFTPIVPDGGYFIMADTSGLGVTFDGKDEQYDFQFTKWMMREKGIAAIPPSAFYSPEHSHISDKLIRFCFCKILAEIPPLPNDFLLKKYGLESKIMKDSTMQEAYKRLREWAEERKK